MTDGLINALSPTSKGKFAIDQVVFCLFKPREQRAELKVRGSSGWS